MSILHNFTRFINSDRYQYTEADIYVANQMHHSQSVFNYFFRKTEDGGFAVVSGTENVLQLIEILNQASRETKLKYFSKFSFTEELTESLLSMEFHGDIDAMQEGELAFPNEPVLTLIGDLLPAKVMETPLLNTYNYQMAIASKASRISRAAGDIPVLAFGPRRAHGFDAAVLGTKAALIGGCALHSSMGTEYLYQVESVGSMSHSFIQSFGVGSDAEYRAFTTFIHRLQENNAPSIFLLIDTYDTLRSGLKNAIKAFQACGIDNDFHGTFGIRLDSGDLAYFSKMCRQELNQAGLTQAKILLTNSLNEYLISELKQQGAPFDLVGVGDALATSKDNPCFGGVYKLVEIDHTPVIKLSNDAIKITTPSHKHVYRIYQNGEARADLITLAQNDPDVSKLLAGETITLTSEEDRFKRTTFSAKSYTIEQITKPMMRNGELTELGKLQHDLHYSRSYYKKRLQTLSPERTRIINPHHYKVNLSQALYEQKYRLIELLKNEVPS
ncbi:nicotinate phosphoribosyltransferase [Entomospira entomophila]|uniref:Nicotinate phosphoribosyltransferase n=1 Tax=Entomospira entomophila TaxID=2719988 RepID=A0A968G8Y4_9SPIO|nr:nicotinate phosphoribosyltransferase [Entomospira entomophilus]NIZ40000.1 nicotinate phosphoribosyltransferase [Entomospira entomophilus]WDI35560.1 nicotinate phosphoribosyltransferase [Entomospira entomophilus]